MTDDLQCPVCPDGTLRRVDPDLVAIPLRRCDACLGLLADHDALHGVRASYHPDHYVLAELAAAGERCRVCDDRLSSFANQCPHCSAEQTLHCPRCARRMALVRVAGVTLDVCKPCRAVWFDRGELGWLTRKHDAALHATLSLQLQASLSAQPAAFPQVRVALRDAVVDPTLAHVAAEVVVTAADASGRCALALADTGFVPHAISSAGDVAAPAALAAAGEAAVETSSSAIDVVVSVLTCLFD